MAGFVYVASPYTDPNEDLMELRVLLAGQATAKLCSEGVFAFSPVIHGHMLQELNPQGYNFWIEHGLSMLRKAQCIQVLTIPGWEVSKGVTFEIAQAVHECIPVHYLPFSKYCDLKAAAQFMETTEDDVTNLVLSYGHVSNRP